MAIGFTIPQAESYNETGGDIQVIPDNDMRRQSDPEVLLAKFGDGYEQRAANGINSLREQYSVTFSSRQKSEIDNIVSFFSVKKGITSFDFTVPDTNGLSNETTIKVVCDSYNTTFMNSEFYTCSATFRRVYES
jgi:phage-related protein